MNPSPQTKHRLKHSAVVLAFAGFFSACVAEAPPAGMVLDDGEDVSNTPPLPCMDLDHDGFGSGCTQGADCDDSDATRASECGAAGQTRACSGDVVEPCYVLKSNSAEGFHCAKGSRKCSGNVWGYCQIEQEYVRPLPVTGLVTGPLTCNPCNPQCATSVDQPQTGDLTPQNSQDVVYDASQDGITLTPTGSGGGSGPDVDGDGVPDCGFAVTTCDPQRSPPYCDPFPNDAGKNCFSEFGDRFHILPYKGPTVIDPLLLDIALKTVDIYFLMDTTGSMQGEIDNLRNSLTSGNLLVNPEECGIDDGAVSAWTGEYFNNISLSCTNPGCTTGANRRCYTRSDADINFNWGLGSPGNPVGSACTSFPSDSFSVRWTATANLIAPGPITFRIQRDNGMRIRVDGTLIYDRWTDTTATDQVASPSLGIGTHSLVVEYFERTIGAQAVVKLTLPPPPGYEGLIGSIRCQIPNTAFGVGYFDDMPRVPYGANAVDSVCATPHASYVDRPFFQLLPSTPAESEAQRTSITNAVGQLQARCGADNPEVQLPALYSLATGAGIADSSADNGVLRYTTPAEQTVPLFDLTAATTQSVGAVGGSGGTTGNLVMQVDAGELSTATRIFNGTTTGMLSSSYGGGCSANSTAPNATYRFTLSQRTTVVLSTDGSGFNTVLNLFNGSSAYLTCNDDISSSNRGSQIITTLNAGTYFVVVDGRNSTDRGAYRLTVGPRAAETRATAYSLGELSTAWAQLSGTTSGMSNDYAGLVCPGGNSLNAADAVFRFSLNQTTNVVVTTQGTAFNVSVRLYNATFGEMVCNNGSGNLAAVTQRLPAGTYFVVVEGEGNNNGSYKLGVGNWDALRSTAPSGGPAPYFTPPQSSCPQAAFGYPCFRPGTIPVVVMFSDTTMHNGPGMVDPYNLATSAYHDATYALRNAGIKVIGVHSGAKARTVCSSPCIEYNPPVCTTRTREACLEYGPSEKVCSVVRVCLQGTCFDQLQCQTNRPCLEYGPQQYQDCNSTCKTYGAQVCRPQYESSESHLRSVSAATGAVKADGEPMVYQIEADGSGLGDTVVQAIADLAGVSRLDITLRLNDNAATPAVDERNFIKAIATVGAPANPADPPLPTSTRCLETLDTWFRGCLPGTDVKFNVSFRNDFVVNTMEDQIFDFTIDVMGDNKYILDTVQVRILVPGQGPSFPAEGSYWRDYDATEYCADGQLPVWGQLQWRAGLPAGTAIRWEVRAATQQADVAAAPVVSWTTPPSTSPVNVAEKMRAAGVTVEQPYLRLTAVLLASPDLVNAPVLRDFELRYDCQSLD